MGKGLGPSGVWYDHATGLSTWQPQDPKLGHFTHAIFAQFNVLRSKLICSYPGIMNGTHNEVLRIHRAGRLHPAPLHMHMISSHIKGTQTHGT